MMKTAVMYRRFSIAIGLGIALALPQAAPQQTAKPQVEVWRTPSCMCCLEWVTHLEANGFAATVEHINDLNLRRQELGIPARYGSCHTAKVAAGVRSYAIEGHVPARDIHRLLRERPSAVGLAVPGMPIGSPGMDGPAYGGRKDPYDVLLVQLDGTVTVFSSYHKEGKH